MKKYLMLMCIFVLCLCANAQIITNSSCDTNLNGEINIADLTNVANKIIGNAANEKEVVTAEQVNGTLKSVETKLDEILARLIAMENDGVYRFNDGFEFVDLGLPSGTLWATFNIGAQSPEEFGDYFAWGETATQTSNRYSWDSYKWSNGDTFENPDLTKYCGSGSLGYNGFRDTLTELESDDDAAKVNWGSAWQMPSSDQLTELLNNCYWEWISGYNGKSVNGYIVYKAKSDSDRGAINNSSSSTTLSASYSTSDAHIFLPAAGNRDTGSLRNEGSYGSYWSRSFFVYNSRKAECLDFGSSDISSVADNRCNGFPVRPVRKR